MKASIIGWLDRERQRYLDAAVDLGIPPTSQRSQLVARNVDVNGAQFSTESRDVSAVVAPAVERRLSEALSEDDGTEQLAQVLHERYGELCHVFSARADLVFDDQPGKWIEANLLDPVLSDYLKGLNSLNAPDPALAEELAVNLLLLIEGEEVDFVIALPLAGIDFDEDPTTIDDVTFRRLTPEELGDLVDVVVTSHRRWVGRIRPPTPDVSLERWVVEIRVRCRKTEQPVSRFRPDRVVLALQLLGFALHGAGQATTWTEPGPPLWTGGHGFRIPAHGGTTSCTPTELERAVRLADLIPEEVFSGPSSPKHVALSRFQLGAADSLPDDALIDYTIALEAFLLPENPDGEYRFKFGLFGAHFLSHDGARRLELFKGLRKIYDLRSKIVHGVRPEDGDVITRAVEEARTMAAGMFVQALESSWPTPEGLQELSVKGAE